MLGKIGARNNNTERLKCFRKEWEHGQFEQRGSQNRQFTSTFRKQVPDQDPPRKQTLLSAKLCLRPGCALEMSMSRRTSLVYEICADSARIFLGRAAKDCLIPP